MFRSLPQYDVIKTEEIADIKSTGTLLIHKKSGARVMILENEDENKVFNIAFRTPPADSTGVAHILEHSVLCGSRKFPSKDPFVELAKGSLNTFLNAMTYPDKTMYPIASCNMQDFCNLMEVYVDAVFYPNIYTKEEIFRQEGWSYVLEKPEDEIIYNGVVYNEMKGAFSSPDDVLDREILNSLYPDTPYGIESGGDPKNIPDLSYEEFLAFHKKYYHPSNSYIYLYGDMDMEERLSWLDREYLSKFDADQVESEITMQPAFAEVKELDKTYSISNMEEEEDNTYLAYNWSVGDVLDADLSAAMSIVEYVLLEAPGAPLKQALLDASVGKDIEGSYDSGVRQPYFSVIAKNSNQEQKEQFVHIIRTVLQEQVEKGLEERTILAGINNLEFKLREADFGHFPKGLMYGIDAFDSWLYDEKEPFLYLKQIQSCEFLKSKLGTGYYEELIQKYLLDNTHASLIVMRPEKGLTAREEERVKEKLAAYKASLTEEEIQQMIEKTKKLRVFQETPSTKEELEKIPLLQLSDIRKETAPIYNHPIDVDGTLLLHHELDTNGIAYLNVMFDAKKLSPQQLSYLGILKCVLGMVDTQNYDFHELSNEINIQSGGIYPVSDVFADMANPGDYASAFEMKAKVLYDKIDFAFDMIEEILFTSSLEKEKRLYEILARLKSRLQVRLTSAGHSTAATRAMAHFSPVSAFNERTGGVALYELVESIETHFEDKKGELVDNLQKLLSALLVQEGLMVSLTSEKEVLSKVEERIRRLRGKLPHRTENDETKQSSDSILIPQSNEGLMTASQVQYVALAGNFRQYGCQYNGALRILRTIMGYEYLWTNIRVQGGAYGCMSGFGKTGDTYLVSYRDPNLGRTLDVYRGISDYLKNFTVDERDMCKYIIGTISESDTPMNPSAKGNRSLNAWMSHVTEEDLQKERDQILGASQRSIRALEPLLRAVLEHGNICVIGGEQKIQSEKELFDQVRPLIRG